MSRGGRYLNKPQKTVKEPGKKVSGKKIALIVVAVILALVLILGGFQEHHRKKNTGADGKTDASSCDCACG